MKKITAQQMLDEIFKDITEDETVAVSQPMRHVDSSNPPWWTVWTSHSQFQRHVKGKHDEWYFCVSSTDGTKSDTGKGLKRKRTNLTRAFCLVLDDIGDDKKTTAKPPIEPDWIIETSEANYQWGFMIDPVDDLDLFEGCVEWTHQQGWGDKGAGGSYRVMRLVGSVNKKPGRGAWEAKLHRWEPMRGSLMDLMADLGCELEENELRALTKKKAMYTSGIDRNFTVRDGIDDVLPWLADRGGVRDGLDGEWVTIQCPNHANHTTGDDAAYYSPLGQGVDEWIALRTFKCHHSHCLEWTSSAFLSWVKDNGGPDAAVYDPMPWLLDRYALIADQEQYADMTLRPRGKWTFQKGEVDFRHSQKVPRGDGVVNVSTAVAGHRDVRRADRLCYKPGAGEIFTNDNQKCINVFDVPDHPETDQVPEMFLRHVNFLLPDPDEAECFLNWLAYKVQQPGARSYAVVMVASEDFGVGRSSLGAFLKKLFGANQVNNATLGQLIGKGKGGTQTFNDWMARCQMVLVEESKDASMDAKTFHTGYEEFKVLIDNIPTMMRINPKFGRTYTEAVYFNCLIFSNHTDAIALPEGDRRVAVMRNPLKRASAAYYEELKDKLNDREAARAYWYLMRRDVSKYDHVYPPQSDAKDLMIEDTMSPVDQILAWLKENHPRPVISRNELEGAVGAACAGLSLGIHQKEFYIKPLWRKFSRLGAGKNGLRVYISGKQVEIRAFCSDKMYTIDAVTAIFNSSTTKSTLFP